MNEREYQVEVSRASARKLAAHVAFLSRVNNAAAWRLHNEILEDIRSLKDYPSSYAYYASKRFPERKLHKKVSAKRYLIVFAIEESNKLVTVVDIQDCRQDTDKKLA
ncbi:MAG: type II toxin-antitoxin system RelE/ParE family toxin [Oscillospiraceae bacterium]|jgi:plasmid stabilization system protein ParE|nr:type II toxin-antitoxin system RelE/ParE family toxin [Oscillospiraceae bacterium]